MVAAKFMPRKRSSGVAQRYLAAIDQSEEEPHQLPVSPGRNSTGKASHKTAKTVCGESCSRDSPASSSLLKAPDTSQDISTPESLRKQEHGRNGTGSFPRISHKLRGNTKNAREHSNLVEVQRGMRQQSAARFAGKFNTTRQQKHQFHNGIPDDSCHSMSTQKLHHNPQDRPLHEQLDSEYDDSSSLGSSNRPRFSSDAIRDITSTFDHPIHHTQQDSSLFTFEKGLDMILSNSWTNCTIVPLNDMDSSLEEEVKVPSRGQGNFASIHISTPYQPSIPRSFKMDHDKRSDVTGASTAIVTNRTSDMALRRRRAAKKARQEQALVQQQNNCNPVTDEVVRKMAHSLLSVSSTDASHNASATHQINNQSMYRRNLGQHVEQQLLSSRTNQPFFQHHPSDGESTSQQSKSLSSSVGVEIGRHYESQQSLSFYQARNQIATPSFTKSSTKQQRSPDLGLGPIQKRTFRVAATSDSGLIAKLVEQQVQNTAQKNTDADSCFSQAKVITRAISQEEPSPDPVFCSKSAHSPSMPSQGSNVGSFESEDALFMERHTALGEESSSTESTLGVMATFDKRQAQRQSTLKLPNLDQESDILSGFDSNASDTKSAITNEWSTLGSDFVHPFQQKSLSSYHNDGHLSEFRTGKSDRIIEEDYKHSVSPFEEILGDPPSSLQNTSLGHCRKSSVKSSAVEAAQRERLIVPIFPLRRSVLSSPPSITRSLKYNKSPGLIIKEKTPSTFLFEKQLSAFQHQPVVDKADAANASNAESQQYQSNSKTEKVRVSGETVIEKWRQKKIIRQSVASLSEKLHSATKVYNTEIEDASVDVKSIRSTFESVTDAKEEDGDDDDSVSVKSLRELFEAPQTPAENSISKVRAKFESFKAPAPKRFETANTDLRDTFTKFEANCGNNQVGIGRHTTGSHTVSTRNCFIAQLEPDQNECLKSKSAMNSALSISVADRIRALSDTREVVEHISPSVTQRGVGGLDGSVTLIPSPDPICTARNSLRIVSNTPTTDPRSREGGADKMKQSSSDEIRPRLGNPPKQNNKPSWMLHREKILMGARSRNLLSKQIPNLLQSITVAEDSNSSFARKKSDTCRLVSDSMVDQEGSHSLKHQKPTFSITIMDTSADQEQISAKLENREAMVEEAPDIHHDDAIPVVPDEKIPIRFLQEVPNNVSLQCFDGETPSDEDSKVASTISNHPQIAFKNFRDTVDVPRTGDSSVSNFVPSFMISDHRVATDVITTTVYRQTRKSPVVIKPVARKASIVVVKPAASIPCAIPVTTTGSLLERTKKGDRETVNDNGKSEDEKSLPRLIAGLMEETPMPQSDRGSGFDSETESGFSDGVTLDLSIAEVSNLTNPTALASTAVSADGHQNRSIGSDDGEKSGDRSIDLIEVEAKKSEASSDQTSEAAAPLIARAMRKIPMSDEISTDSYFRAQSIITNRRGNTSGWDARNILDISREDETQPSLSNFDIISKKNEEYDYRVTSMKEKESGSILESDFRSPLEVNRGNEVLTVAQTSSFVREEKKEDDFVSVDRSWDIHQMQSLFPFEPSSDEIKTFAVRVVVKNSFEEIMDWNPFPSTSASTIPENSNLYFQDVEEHLDRASRSKTPPRTNRSRPQRQALFYSPTNVSTASSIKKLEQLPSITNDRSKTTYNHPFGTASDIGTSYYSRYGHYSRPPRAESSAGSSDYAASAATTGVLDNRSTNPANGSKHAALLARIRALKAARLRRAAATYNGYSSNSFTRIPSFGELSQSTGNSSTGFGGSSFMASLQVD